MILVALAGITMAIVSVMQTRRINRIERRLNAVTSAVGRLSAPRHARTAPRSAERNAGASQ